MHSAKQMRPKKLLNPNKPEYNALDIPYQAKKIYILLKGMDGYRLIMCHQTGGSLNRFAQAPVASRK